MTYLNIINNVLRRLREDEVTAVTDTEYATMVGDLVNDALALCQAAHNWSSLFTEIDITTVADQQEYNIDGMGQMGQVYYAYDDTNNVELKQIPHKHMMLQTNLGGGSASGTPVYYSYKDVAADDDPNILLWPIPSDVYTLTFHVKKDQAVVSDGATEILIPEQPVIQYALAFAKEERGELGGNSAPVAFEKAKLTLANYVALDMERHPELGIWQVQ